MEKISMKRLCEDLIEGLIGLVLFAAVFAAAVFGYLKLVGAL